MTSRPDMDARDLALAIAAGIRTINAGTGDIISGLICDGLSADDQLRFAHQLVGVAELLRCRVTGESAPVSVVDGAAPGEALHRPGPDVPRRVPGVRTS